MQDYDIYTTENTNKFVDEFNAKGNVFDPCILTRLVCNTILFTSLIFQAN